MILYKSDWARYPTAIADYKTKNTSFLVLAETYRRMGIENYDFILSLLQPELQGVDPFSPDLTKEQKFMITREVKWNPWYYLREVSRVPIQGVAEPSVCLANRALIAMFWSWLNGFDYCNILPRQCGKSVGADILNNWVINLAGVKTTVQLFTHSNKLRAENISRLKKIRGTLPAYLNYFQPGVDADNMERLTCAKLENQYLSSVAQKDKDGAHNAGRGLTSPIIQVDEGPFCPNIHISLPVALGSTGAARDFAEANGTFMGNIFTTTAGKRDTEEGGYMYNLIHNGMYWNEKLLDTFDKTDARKMVKANSRIVDEEGEELDVDIYVINGTFSAMQIGKSRKWLKTKIAGAHGTREDAERDYLNVWTSGSETSPLDTMLLGIIRDAIRDPVYTEVTKNLYIMEWFIEKHEVDKVMESGKFAITLDTANMSGKDANALHIIDLRTMALVGSSTIKEASLHVYGDWIAGLLLRFPTTTLIIENKSSAQGILDHVVGKLLSHGINPFERIFNRLVDERSKYEAANKELKQRTRSGDITEEFYFKHKGKFGFMTTGQSRHKLYGEVFQRAAKTTGHLVCYKTLSDQIRGLVMKNNRVDHGPKSHDDSVISWLMGHWFSTNAMDTAYYGIPPGYMQSMVSETGATLSKEELVSKAHQENLLDKINSLKEVIADTDNDFIIKSTELKIAKLARGLDDSTQDKILSDLFERAHKNTKQGKSLKDAVNRRTKKASGWY